MQESMSTVSLIPEETDLRQLGKLQTYAKMSLGHSPVNMLH